MQNTNKMVRALSMIDSINYGGCGLAALAIAKEVKKDGLTPVFLCNGHLDEKKPRLSSFGHVVVRIKETGQIVDSEGVIPNGARQFDIEVSERVLRKVVRTKDCWNPKFDRYNLRALKHVI